MDMEYSPLLAENAMKMVKEILHLDTKKLWIFEENSNFLIEVHPGPNGPEPRIKLIPIVVIESEEETRHISYFWDNNFFTP